MPHYSRRTLHARAGGFDRRTLLKSTGLLISSSAFSSTTPGGAQSAQGQRNSNAVKGILQPMIGFMLAHEQFPVPQLVELGAAAEQAGFDLLATSDHLQPWQSNEGHSGEAWVTTGALGQRTRRAWMGPTVTCPTFRYNPAVVAEAFAFIEPAEPGENFSGTWFWRSFKRESRDWVLAKVGGALGEVNRSDRDHPRALAGAAGES